MLFFLNTRTLYRVPVTSSVTATRDCCVSASEVSTAFEVSFPLVFCVSITYPKPASFGAFAAFFQAVDDGDLAAVGAAVGVLAAVGAAVGVLAAVGAAAGEMT